MSCTQKGSECIMTKSDKGCPHGATVVLSELLRSQGSHLSQGIPSDISPLTIIPFMLLAGTSLRPQLMIRAALSQVFRTHSTEH